MKKEVIFELNMAPGDSLVFTSVLRDLYLNYPNTYSVDVHNYYPEIFKNNPYITKLKKEENTHCYRKIKHSDVIFNRNNWKHYSEIFNLIVSETLGITIQQNSIYPELYLDEKEKSENILKKLNVKKPFWILNSSFKIDMPLKSWIPYKWKELSYELLKRGLNIYQCGTNTDIFEELPNIQSLIGKTENIRDFISLCYHSSGIVTHTSFLVHIAAVFRKPCIVINGAREYPTYSCYPTQQVIHTNNVHCHLSIDGCFKKQRNECINMVGSPPYPLCMSMISINEVILNVMKYAI